jgi:CheY-like chemotaxis protein
MKAQGKQSYQILVVDDEPTVCKAIKMLLEFDGHQVLTADSGESGLARFQEGRFDLVITDYSMQEMKGDQLVAQLKKLRPEQAVIMATAFAEEIRASGKLSSGVNVLLSKPFSLQELRDAIAQAMS